MKTTKKDCHSLKACDQSNLWTAGRVVIKGSRPRGACPFSVLPSEGSHPFLLPLQGGSGNSIQLNFPRHVLGESQPACH